MTSLNGWENFYVIVGSSAGALIGLQFVVITLIAESPALRMEEAGAAFATPTIVHFGVVLFAVCDCQRPLERDRHCRSSLGLGGSLRDSLLRHRGPSSASANYLQTGFRGSVVPCSAPICSIRGPVASAGAAHFNGRPALFLAAAAVLVLLFVGIHNAWTPSHITSLSGGWNNGRVNLPPSRRRRYNAKAQTGKK